MAGNFCSIWSFLLTIMYKVVRSTLGRLSRRDLSRDRRPSASSTDVTETRTRPTDLPQQNNSTPEPTINTTVINQLSKTTAIPIDQPIQPAPVEPVLYEVLTPSTPYQEVLPASQLSIDVQHRPRARSYSPRRYGFHHAHDNDSAPFNERFYKNTIVVYTDGSCIDDIASGFGIFFGEDHPLNTSEGIRGREHNSGLAEILGAQTALTKLLEWSEYNDQRVIVRTDYLPLITAMNLGNEGRFAEEYDILRELAAQFPKGVEFQHVYGHNGDPGNEKADELAGNATAWARNGRSRSLSRPRDRSRSPNHSRNRARSKSRSRNNAAPRSPSKAKLNNQGLEIERVAFVAASDVDEPQMTAVERARNRKMEKRSCRGLYKLITAVEWRRNRKMEKRTRKPSVASSSGYSSLEETSESENDAERSRSEQKKILTPRRDRKPSTAFLEKNGKQ